MQKTELIIDPPEGWMHGFPKVVPPDIIEHTELLSAWLVKNGYPEEHIELAIRYSRYWERSV